MDKSEYLYNAKIVNVVDGDTVDAMIDLGFNISFRERLRLYGIDTPELNSRDTAVRESARIATDFVIKHVLGRTVLLKTYKKDKFGRYLAEIFFDDQCLNQMLVENKLATPYLG